MADTYDDHAEMSHYVDPSMLLKALISIIGFVDDNNIALNGSK